MTGATEFTGRARRVSGTISTDDILPARWKHSTSDPLELAAHVFEHVRPDLAPTLRPGDVLVCDGTFGIGSSREQAVSALAAAGVRALVAPAFGRILFRNAWNLALPALVVTDARPPDGARLRIDLRAGTGTWEGGTFGFGPVSEWLLEIVGAGGLLAHLARDRAHAPL